MKVLVLNSGSSSQKSCLYEIGNTIPSESPACLWEGKMEWGPHAAKDTLKDTAEVTIKNSRGVSRKYQTSAPRGDVIEDLLRSLWSGDTQSVPSPSTIDAVGHRVVHGGPKHFNPSFVSAEIRTAIEGVSAFAPLHNRAELQGIETISKLLPEVPQVAVFDTAFHHDMPLPAATYPGPYEWLEQGIRRYGFHGINHQYCAERAAYLLRKPLTSLKLVTCHLGNGCSLAAIRDGRSVDTTMGFTPLEGLMMGTRSGSVDPGILTYLVREQHLSGQQLDDILNHKSGLLGISGISGDMRQIQAAANDGHERAKLAFDIYIHRLRAGIGAMIAALGGIDALVFTAGVGENSADVRSAVCDPFAFLDLKIDTDRNVSTPLDTDISTPNATTRVLIIHAQEDWMIARECWKLVRSQ